MELPATPFTLSKLAQLPLLREIGATGETSSRVAITNGVRVRLVEYGPNYRADHWCDRGHVFYLLNGNVTIELRDGRSFPMKTGDSFQVSDNGDSAHRVYTETGGTAFIVD